jgi:hypothetical protein
MPSYPSDRSSDVPDNKFGLTLQADLQRRETPLALRRLLELQQDPITGKFDTGICRLFIATSFRMFTIGLGNFA